MSRTDSGVSARSQFRKAQLQAKRNADIAKRKERELLLSSAREGDGGRRKKQENFTQGDLEVNASSDVTAALRRTHDLMQSELSRSQFAQETLGSLTQFTFLIKSLLTCMLRTIHCRSHVTVGILQQPRYTPILFTNTCQLSPTITKVRYVVS